MVVLLVCLIGVSVSFVEKTSYIKNLNESQDRTYEIITDFVPHSESFLEKVSLFKDDKLVWSKECPGGSHFIISNSGAVVSTTPAGQNTILNFYDRNGVLKTTHEIPFSQSGSFTKDGEFFFFLSGTDGLYMFDKVGTIINNFGKCHKYACSNNGKIVALVYENSLTVYADRIPVSEMSAPSPHVRSVVMSEDGTILALIDNQYVCVYDLTEEQQIYKVEIKNPIALNISPNGGLIVVLQEERDVTSRVNAFLFNLEKELVWQWSNKFKHEYETVHCIKITKDNELHIYATDDLFRFSIE